MREVICKECGAKTIDNSFMQNKEFCGSKCAKRWDWKHRTKPVEIVCPFNAGVVCFLQTCGSCGWNPEVEQRRKERLL